MENETPLNIINAWCELAFSNNKKDFLKHFFNARMIIENKKNLSNDAISSMRGEVILFIKLNCRDTKQRKIILEALNDRSGI